MRRREVEEAAGQERRREHDVVDVLVLAPGVVRSVRGLGPEADDALAEILVEPLFTSLHSDPRWLPFLRKLGMAPEQLAAIKFDVSMPK